MATGTAALSLQFFARRALVVAPELIGRYLVRKYRGRIFKGIIAETGAYEGGRASLEVAPSIITIDVFQGGNRVPLSPPLVKRKTKKEKRPHNLSKITRPCVTRAISQ